MNVKKFEINVSTVLQQFNNFQQFYTFTTIKYNVYLMG